MRLHWFFTYENAIKALRIARRIFPDKHFYIQNDVPVHWYRGDVIYDTQYGWSVNQGY